MNNELDNTIGKEASVRDAIELMSKNHTPAVAIVGTDNELLGLFTNGDMRQFFLEDGDLAAPIVQALNRRKKSITQKRIIHTLFIPL